MTVRLGQASDLPVLEAVQRVLSEPAPELLAGALTSDGPLSVFVATESDRTPVGYVIVLPGPSAVYVPELAVLPAHQREGYGSALLSAVVTVAREQSIPEIRLTVAASNEQAQAFYESHDFTVRERIPGRFDAGDGVVLAKPTVSSPSTGC